MGSHLRYFTSFASFLFSLEFQNEALKRFIRIFFSSIVSFYFFLCLIAKQHYLYILRFLCLLGIICFYIHIINHDRIYEKDKRKYRTISSCLRCYILHALVVDVVAYCATRWMLRRDLIRRKKTWWNNRDTKQRFILLLFIFLFN